ncbi:MAG: hypothetical protein HQL95_00260 [Magnetococcales bacterium]|nr:hypothetical protein [Magnetococcales bacterium]
MAIASQVYVPPVRFGGFNSVRARLGSGTPAQTVTIGIDQRQGVGVMQTPIAVGANQHQGLGVPQAVLEKADRSIISSGIIVGGQTTITPEGEQITQVWSG